MTNLKYHTVEEIKKTNILKKIILKKTNNSFFTKQDKKYGKYLIINGYPLDKFQKRVVYSEDKYTMVIAGAGSGKSTTIIGKIKYLTYVKKIDASEIIAISFTNESVNNLKKTLEKNGIQHINVTTFHKLSLSFLKKVTILPNNFLKIVIKEYLSSNEYTYKKNIILWATKEKNYLDIHKKIDEYVDSIAKIISLCHTNDYNLKNFEHARKKIMNQFFWKRKSLLSMLYIIMDIYYLYQEEKEATNSIDFDDMIIKASKEVINSSINYKYIIIDEYQDTSLIRVKLVQQIIKKCNCNLLVVGDDYQSIYRFNGCDVNMFLNFRKYFKNPLIIKLQNTYRNSQEIINISQKFILKNPYQIRKKLMSNKHLKNPIKIIYYNEHNKEKTLLKTVKMVDQLGSYYILGRNNFDLVNITQKKLNYLTIHKSKGLEADNIIIINLQNDIYGLPNQIMDLNINKMLFKQINYYPFDEERRLFYVALTRTKNYVYLLVNKKNSSIFIEELIQDNNLL